MADLQVLLDRLSGTKAWQTAGALLQGGSVDHLDWPDYAKTTIANTRQMLPPPANPATPSPGWNQGVRDVAHGMFVQPVEDAAKALRGQMTDAEAQDFAFGAAAGLIPMGRGLRAAKGIRAYHGSPHDFDRFDMSKIGTGEGAQAYGHGLYFAENEGVARAYRDQLAKDMYYTPAGQMFDPQAQLQHLNVRVAAHRNGTDLDATIARARELLPKVSTEQTRAMIEHDLQVLQSFKDAGGVAKQPGRMYEVNINAHPDQFLDWDKPLSKQGEQIQDALRGITPPHQRGQNAVAAAGVIGPEFGKAAASKNLLDRGIPGIKYLDQGSRTAGEGSRNYVVFDDKLIDILRKYGIAGLGVGGVLGAGTMPKAEAEPLKMTVRPE